MKDYLIAGLIVVFVLGLLTLLGWYEISVWNECRTDHSWFYCQRVLF